jgi:hypothetical protein
VAKRIGLENSMVDQLVSLIRKNLTVILMAIALLRIFVFNAAFPVFNNIDEGAHFDLVLKYSNGYLPTPVNLNYDRESAEFIARNGTFEYLSPPQSTLPPVTNASVQAEVAETVSSINHEAISPPLYYLIAGLWLKIGKLLQLSGGMLIYWVRFINLPLYLLLMLVSTKLCREIAPDNDELQQGVLLLLVFFPQSVFYSVNNDVLSAIVFPAAVVALLRLTKNNPGTLSYLTAGALVASLPLTKVSNIPGLVVLALLICNLCYCLYYKVDNVKARLWKLSLLIASAVLPPVVWFGRTYYVFGDWTGVQRKIAQLGWTAKPLDTLYDHPIFTLSGFTFFASELVKSFWRGELVWHLRPVSLLLTDYFYVLTTGFALFFGVLFCCRRGLHASDDRFMFLLLNVTIFLNVALLAILSIRYDFGTCWYPSKDLPYFTSGRLIIGMLVPFLILYVHGIHTMRRIWHQSTNIPLLFTAIGMVCLLSEVFLYFQHGYSASPFNFFNILLNA